MHKGRFVAHVSALALIASMGALSASPTAADPGDLTPSRSVDAAFGTPPPGSKAQPEVAAGVIVKTTGAVRKSVAAAAASALGVDRVLTTAITRTTRAHGGDDLIPVAEAERIAAELEDLPGVAWAEPNRMAFIAETTWPTPVNDAHWALLRNVWDTRDQASPAIQSLQVSPWPAGGYGTKAPALWPATTGTGVTVAVLDNGIRENHPDLAPNLLNGYDMISQGPSTSFVNANDGDGRDANPSDPGDWNTGNECGFGEASRTSTWHGTHVAGTIAAVANNAQGVVGMAPGAKILPVRVLGKCGGSTADIAAGILWAAGVSVPGIPANPNPARIINMSLGGPAEACSQTYADAITAARSVNSSVFVALGNDNQPAGGYQPANCPGIIGVHSTSQFGDHASYSNFGPEADISAPGGDESWEGPGTGILSTVDTGTTTPVGAGYASKDGTSMATPAAAGIGALLLSLGSFTPDQLEAAIKASVTGFPTSGNTTSGFLPCNVTQCGTGILDATKIPAPLGTPAISGTPEPGATLTVADVAWHGPAPDRAFTWFLNGCLLYTSPSPRDLSTTRMPSSA